ncbi:MAG: hypothetical protein IPI19_00565 [Ignavibacteriales bacterium]|nr:hypothetical protein [Ignavibacteriales bacterium]
MKSKYFLFLCLSFLIFNSSLLIGTQSVTLAKPAQAHRPTQAGKPPQTAYKSALTFVLMVILFMLLMVFTMNLSTLIKPLTFGAVAWIVL